MVHGCMVYTEHAEMAAVLCGISHASAVTQSKYTALVDIQKAHHSRRITCKCSDCLTAENSAIKSDQQQHYLRSLRIGLQQSNTTNWAHVLDEQRAALITFIF